MVSSQYDRQVYTISVAYVISRKIQSIATNSLVCGAWRGLSYALCMLNPSVNDLQENRSSCGQSHG